MAIYAVTNSAVYIMETLSIGQRVIMHLDRFRMTDPTDIYNIPWDLTQDGIATSLRISRAHASLELKKLRESGKVEEKQTHIKGGKVKRKSYLLTPLGFEEVPKIRKKAEDNGIDIDALLDLKRMNADLIIDGLSDEDMYALGCACAFRIPVPLEILPKANKSVIPTDVTGYTIINDILRKNIMTAADPTDCASWHSYAADYWLSDSQNIGDLIDRLHERLYHLVESGRMIDACKLISKNMYDLINTYNDDLRDLLSRLERIPNNLASDVYSVIIETSLADDDLACAEKAISSLSETDKDLSELYRSDVEYRKGNKAQAMAILTALSHSNPLADIRIARIVADNGRYEEAKKILISVSAGSNPNVGVERFVELARIDMLENHDSDAYAHLMKAKSSVPDKGKKRIDNLVKELNIKL